MTSIMNNTHIITISFIALFFWACNEQPQTSEEEATADTPADSVRTAAPTAPEPAEGAHRDAAICEDPFTWIGGIQGVKTSDSTRIYPMGECSQSDPTYRLIWVPNVPFKARRKWKHEDVADLFDKTASRDKNFTCYKFELPLHDREVVGPDGETVIFPCEVTVYKATTRGWKALGDYGVSSQAAFGRLQVNTVFGITEEQQAKKD